MKKRMMFMLAAGALLLTACAAPKPRVSNNTSTGKTIKIGMNMELSGAVAAYGEAEKNGIDLAVKKINSEGGVLGKKIELITKDNKSDNIEAATVASNLSIRSKVSAIVGPATSGAVKAAIPNVTKAKVPMVTPSATDDAITLKNGKVQPYVFRSCFQDSFQGTMLAKYGTETLKAKNAVIIGDNSSDYAIGLTKAFKKEFKGNIVAEENFTTGDKDFQALLTKIKNKKYDFIYIPGYYNEAGLIIKQAREMGITVPILGADGFGDEKLVQTAGKANITNIFYTGHFSTHAPANDTVSEFIASYKKEYGADPSAFNALGYDAVMMIKQAIEDEQSASASDIKHGLENLSGFKGVTGTMKMDKNHNPEKSAVVLGLTKGKETSAQTINP
jgi:branched-chain amino acid transport system substrate-binding protein